MTSAFSRKRWQTLIPYLDQALERTLEERESWLACLRGQDAGLADDLAALLDELRVVQDEGFLDGDRVPRPRRSALAGETIGAYRLVSRIGQGGMGSVWLADRHDGSFAGRVAIKILNPGLVGHAGEERFKREGSILARLTHPNIAHLVDAGVTAGGQPYLVLEHVDGRRIDRYCDDHGFGVEARLRLFLDVLSAVAHAHASLVVHRDIKPSNVLVSGEGRVKLLDFGIAKLLEPETGGEPSALTREGGPALTPEYAAPEQMTGGAITTATDVYALGVLLYQLLCGRHPAGDALRAPSALLKAVVETEPPRVSEAVDDPRRRRRLRGDLDTIVAKALKKAAGERYASVTAFADDVRRHLDRQPIRARPDTLVYRAATFVRRNRLPVGLAALVLVALVGGLAATVRQTRLATRAAQATARERDLALTQLERAENINEFTSFLLGQALPADRPMPVDEILARAEHLVDRRFAQDEALAVDVLTSIGNIYFLHDETDNAHRLLKRAFEASSRVADPAVRAAVACDWASAVGATGDFVTAGRLITEALAITTEETRFDRVVAGCLVDQAEVAMEAAAPRGVVVAASRALDRLARRPAAFPEIRARALEMAAVGRNMEGDAAASDRLFTEAQEQLRRIGRQDTIEESVLLQDWALNAGLRSPLDALALLRRAIDSIQKGGTAQVPMTFRFNYGLQLSRLARFAEARTVQDEVRADARRHGNALRLGMSSFETARSCRRLGDLPCARAALEEAAHALSGYTSPHYALADLAREQGLLAAAEGRPDDARRRLRDALAIHERVGSRRVPHIETLLELSRLEVRAGDSADADTHAHAALALAQSFRGRAPHSAWVGLSELALGDVAEARGDRSTELTLLRDAVENMTPTLGARHPAVAEARRRLAHNG